jgi:hypothetical protein
MPRPETEEHKRLKSLLRDRLEEWFGASIDEYSDSGHELDIFSVSLQSTKLMIEIIWTPTKANFVDDMEILLTSEADIMIPVVNPKILQNSKLGRRFQKIRLSLVKRGKRVSNMIDGIRILNDVNYLNNEFKGLIDNLVGKPITADENTKGKDLVDANFRENFLRNLDILINDLKTGYSGEQTNDLIDIVIMMLKERIDKWDVPSIKFATQELFMKLYKFSENERVGLEELYNIFRDLFTNAYTHRKYLALTMIEVFNIILLKSWVPEYNVEMGEKAAKVLT